MFEGRAEQLFMDFHKRLEEGRINPRDYLTAVYELRDKLDRMALPLLGVDPDQLATHNIMRFKGYGPGTLMPNSGVRGMVPMRVDNTHGPDYEPHWILLQRREDSGEWGIPSGFANADDIDEASAFIREAREELGITVTGIEMIARTSSLARCNHTYHNGDRIVGRDNLYRVTSYEGNPNLTRDTEQEGLELNFFNVDHLPEPFVEMHRYPVELFKKHLETGRFVMG